MRALPKGIRYFGRSCAHVTEAHPFVHSAPCAAAPVRTPPVARDRWRDVGRGRHQECAGAKSSLPSSRHASTAPARRSRGKPRTSLDAQPSMRRWAPEYFPGRSVQCSYFVGRIRDVSLVTEGARPSSLAQEQAGGHAARLTTLLLVVVVPQRVVGDQGRLQRRA